MEQVGEWACTPAVSHFLPCTDWRSASRDTPACRRADGNWQRALAKKRLQVLVEFLVSLLCWHAHSNCRAQEPPRRREIGDDAPPGDVSTTSSQLTALCLAAKFWQSAAEVLCRVEKQAE